MEFKDYYQILGVERDASDDDIRRAYRKLARKYHPDVSKEADAEQRMRDVNEAYQVLRDQEKRGAYDNLAAGVSAGGGFQPPPGWDHGFEFRGGHGGEDEAFSEFFSSLFGRGRRGGGSAQFRSAGEDSHATIDIDLEDALHGATRNLSLRSMGADARGRAQVQERTLSVNIPAGVHEGQRIRLTGQGGHGFGGGPDGDLYLEVHFKPHSLYKIDGRDLSLRLPVTPWEAALGATVRVPTPQGPVDLGIPANSRQGARLRLRGRGIPGKTPGNLYVELDIVLPPADTERAREAYRQMERELPFNPRERWPG